MSYCASSSDDGVLGGRDGLNRLLDEGCRGSRREGPARLLGGGMSIGATFSFAFPFFTDWRGTAVMLDAFAAIVSAYRGHERFAPELLVSRYSVQDDRNALLCPSPPQAEHFDTFFALGAVSVEVASGSRVNGDTEGHTRLTTPRTCSPYSSIPSHFVSRRKSSAFLILPKWTQSTMRVRVSFGNTAPGPKADKPPGPNSSTTLSTLH